MAQVQEKEKCLWDILKEEYNFKPHVYEIPTTTYQEFREFWFPAFWLKWFPVKTAIHSTDEWMEATINGNKFEVMMFDIWYVRLIKNGTEIFDGRRFENEDFLKLLV